MRFFLATLSAGLILAACAGQGKAQQPNYYNIKPGPAVGVAHGYNGTFPGYTSLRPRSYITGPYQSPFTPYYRVGQFPGPMPYPRYTTFVPNQQTAPIYYYDGATNTYYYGRGYFLAPLR